MAPPCELLSYQPTAHHGHAVFRFLPEREGRGQPHQDLAHYGGFMFKDQGYEFYRYPEPSNYPLKRALYELWNDDELRGRFIADIAVHPRRRS